MKKQKERPVCEISGGTPPLHSRTAPECRKRRRFAGTVASLAIGLLLFGMVRSAGAADGKVDLLVDGDRFQPSTTLEFRFPEPMVERDLLGIAAPLSEAPVAIEPNLPGAFTWLSRRSGVYVPSAPPELGKTYRVTLRAGLKNASGEPMKAKLDQ